MRRLLERTFDVPTSPGFGVVPLGPLVAAVSGRGSDPTMPRLVAELGGPPSVPRC